MIPFGVLEEATFEERPNRYLAIARLRGQPVRVHVPDPGRMKELLVPGRTVYVEHVPSSRTRKTEYSLVLVDCDGVLVSINTQVPNRLVHQALKKRAIPVLAEYSNVRAEVPYESSRFDFHLQDVCRECYVEVKSVGWMRDGTAWFPDAVTARGAKHVRELSNIVAAGKRAVVIFISQRDDVGEVRIDAGVDPRFATAFHHALAAGVETRAYRCRVDHSRICLDREIPVIPPDVV